ncbi:MAG: hypothetical protein ACRCW4_00495 [Candidatus Neomicrothrix subdominans]
MTTPPPLPRLGPCELCGTHPDQRHRIRDAIIERLLADEPATDVCADYDWTPAQFLALVEDIDANLIEMIQPATATPCASVLPRLGGGGFLCCELPTGHPSPHRDGETTWTSL